MSRHWRQLTPEQQQRALLLAMQDPERPWSDIAKALGVGTDALRRYLRSSLGLRRGSRDWRGAIARAKQLTEPSQGQRPPSRTACPSCRRPVPRLADATRYRCPCGRLIAA